MIKELTKEQRDKIPLYYNKWFRNGVSTQPLNKEKARPHINWIYKEMLGKEPPILIMMDSPMSCQLAANILKQQKDSKLYLELGSKLDSELDLKLRSKLRSKLNSKLISKLNSELHSELVSKLSSNLGSKLYSELGSKLYSELSLELKLTYFYFRDESNYWAGYYCFYDFIQSELLNSKKVRYQKEMNDFCFNVGFYIPFDNICFISQRPSKINYTTPFKLHSEVEKSIQWRDGWGFYSLNGITVPSWLIETPRDQIDKTKILALTNTEQRQAAMKFVGYDQFEKELKAEILDQRGDYKLMTFEYESRRVGPYLKMKDSSSNRIFVEGVGDPTSSGLNTKITTIDEALEWRAKRAAGALLTKLGYELEIAPFREEA